MTGSGTELILLQHNSASADPGGIDYSPTKISTDKRLPAGTPSTLGYYQIGVNDQYGYAFGPVFKVEFVDLSAVTATHIKIWGLDNKDDNAPIYPKSYLVNHPLLKVYLKKFEFVNSAGTVVPPGGAYTVVGYKKRALPYSY